MAFVFRSVKSDGGRGTRERVERGGAASSVDRTRCGARCLRTMSAPCDFVVARVRGQLGVGGEELRSVDRFTVLYPLDRHFHADRLSQCCLLRVVVLLATAHDGLDGARGARDQLCGRVGVEENHAVAG